MILIVAAENTDILIGCADEKIGTVLFNENISTDLRKTTIEYSITIKQITELHGIRLRDIDGGIIASCVPSLTAVSYTHLDVYKRQPLYITMKLTTRATTKKITAAIFVSLFSLASFERPEFL